MEEGERRLEPRTRLAACPAARVRALREVRLLDLSRTGAQIEHLDLLRPGAACTLDIPLAGGAWNLPAQAVWCTVVGRRRKFGGASYLVARSGLRFRTLTARQETALADTLHYLTTSLQPTAPGGPCGSGTHRV